MSNRERIISLLDNVPDYKMGYIYENDPDPEKDKTYTLEECKREWGLA